jgi:DNA polymerase
MAFGGEEGDAWETKRLAYLEAMGVQAWSLRTPLPDDADAPSPLLAAEERSEDSPPLPMAEEQSAGGRPVISPLPAGEGPGARAFPSCTWEELQTEVAACTACPLHKTRTQTVFGVGDRQAQWMVIGEAPGEQEDLQGEPFVGRAGLLLNEMLRAIGLQREQVYIANILKCRPPKNRDPQPAEAEACERHLLRQLALIQPKIILAVGRIAAQNLLKTAAPIGKLRGAVHDYRGVPLVVVYHPAYLLRSPLEKRRAWDDLRLALQVSRRGS